MKKSTLLKTTLCSLVMLLGMVFVGFAQGTDDFNTLANNTSYNTKTTSSGWVIENAQAPSLGTANTPSCDRKCVIINGKTSAVGSIKSPVLSGGCRTLSFVYANPFAESNGAKFLVQVQGKAGNILYEEEVVKNSMTQGETYSYSADIKVLDEFVIYIKNLSPSKSTSNKDRLAIACINWTGYVDGISITKPTISPNGGTIFGSQEIKLACATEGAKIYYTLDGSEPTEKSTLYKAPFTINKSATVKAVSVYNGEVSEVVSANFNAPESVTIEGFKNAPQGATVYALENVTYVYRNGRYIYIQDETGSLVIYDNATPVITTNYKNGDVIPMVYGTKTVYNKLNELVPVVNTAAATENRGEVKPIVLTAEEIASNLAKYESKLVTIEKGTFAAATLKNNAVNVDYTQNGTKLVCRTGFKNITMTIPAGYKADLTGFVTVYNSDAQIFPRDINDIVPATLFVHKYAFNQNASYPEVGGSFEPVKPVEEAKYGTDFVTTMVAAPHYHLNHLYISNSEYKEGTDYTEGEDVIAKTVKDGNVYTYKFNVVDDQSVKAVFARNTYKIQYNILAGEGSVDNGAVLKAPATSNVFVDYDENYTSTFAAAPGFHIVSVIIDGVNYGPISTWTFNNMVAAHDIDIEFAPNTYEITTTAMGVGNVTKGVKFTYDPEYSYTFKATPMKGYHIESITRNNVELTIDNPEVAYEETLINILENYNYVAQFAANTYTITATAGANGLITPAGVTSYDYNADATYEIIPAKGYYVQDVKVDGESKGAIRTFTFAKIITNHTIEATFAAYQYTITVKEAENGKITPETSKYGYGETPTFEMIPAAGYGVQDVTVDGKSMGAVSSYTFPELTANHEIAATFAQYKYTVTATANEGGKISPAGVTNLIANGNQTYTITPDKGYHINNVVVDGVSMGTVSSYKFTNVNENHTIYVSFALDELTITVNQPANGAINPGTTTVKYGDMPTFTVSAARGYEVKDITVDGKSVLASASNSNGVYTYTFPAVNKSMTLTAKTAAKQYTITASADANGKITPAGVTTVNFGGNQEYVIVPNEGYEIANVSVDGLSMGAIDRYTFVNVTYNRTINVTFRLMNCEIPTNAHTINIDTTSAMLTWYHPTATSFDVQYKAIADQTYESATVNAMEYVVTGLKPSTTYIWMVRANCVPNNPSAWSNGTIFRTADVPVVPERDTTAVADYVKSLVKVYSNMNNVYIVNENDVQIKDVQVYDIYGKLIYAGKNNGSREIISMDVATGNYIVRLFTDRGIANYKLYLSK